MVYLILSVMWGIMGYSFYTGDDSYLNIVTIYYSLIIILAGLGITFCSLMTYNLKNLNPEAVKGLIKLFKKPSPLKKVINIIMMITSIVLMILNGYVVLVLFYILTVIWVNICFSSVNEGLFEGE